MSTPEQIHTMDDNTLRVKIAEALGWTHMRTFVHLKDESLLFGNPPDGKTFERVPNWPADLNAAAELTKITQAAGVGFEICDASYGDGHWEWECTLFDGIGRDCKTYKSSAATEPRARSEAWLMWYEATHE
jgi:hypothetical protein